MKAVHFNFISIVVATAWLSVWPAFGQVQPPKMVELTQIFRDSARELSLRYRETIAALPRQYEQDIATLRDRSQANGDLDGVLAASKELKRYQAAMAAERDPFELTPEMPPEALVAKPAELRLLQEQYIGRFKEAAVIRIRGIKDLTSKYVKTLQILQSELTRAGRIAEAIVVKQEAERLQPGLDDGALLQLVEKITAELPADDNAQAKAAVSAKSTDAEIPIYGSVPNWAKWKYTGSGKFARERSQFNHPDLPDELYVKYNEKTGRGSFSGRCAFNSSQIGAVLSYWFGKALVWQVEDVSTMSATFVLSSRHISAGQDHGPAVQLAVLSNGQPLRAINVNLQETETTLRLLKDPNSDRCALMWPSGRLTETFDLPAAGNTISVLLGVTVRNPGELCETSLVILP